MKRYFIDTNIFVRALTNDDPKKLSACRKLFMKAAAGEVELYMSSETLAEVIYVICSTRTYNYPHDQLVDKLLPILELKKLILEEKQLYIAALVLYAEMGIDWADVVNYVKQKYQGVDVVYSYDKDYDKFTDIKRKEP